ncbi:aldehyde dehydrogenase family protein [Haloechinothrix salitolerans]|uniref:Aldehyde dehydrogenase family protein n=1 Tax=Haloechinothrix salitolerans TaxID=926830 RepID=A0ABW2C639_9PSEU
MTAVAETRLADSVTEFLASPKQLLIGGEWVPAASGRTFTTEDPATSRVLTEVAHGAAEDIDRAVAAARKAFDDGPWRRFTPSQRQRVIWQIGEKLLERAEQFAQLESLDNGKSAAIAQAVDVPWSADVFHYYAGWATKIEGRTIPVSVPWVPDGQFHAYTLREPVGVCGQIVPWNFPLLMATWKIAPALAAGNTVVLKPAEQTPLTALLLGEIIQELDLPPGVVNIVPGFGDAGAAIAAHEDVDKVAFTGSTEVGKLIVAAAGGDLKKVSLELGGKSPQVIYADADLELAIAGSSAAWMFNQGQSCVAGSRMFIEESIFDEFTQGVAEHVKQAKIGPGLDPASQICPLVSQEQLDRVSGYVQQGLSDGARAVTGGNRHGDVGYFIEPTVLVDVAPEMSVVREEIFGPVVVATPFDPERGAKAEANDTPYGLAAGVWTRDISKAHRLAREIKAGTVWVNCYNAFDSALPFGGYKQSGWGRELGEKALDLYTEHKSINVQL